MEAGFRWRLSLAFLDSGKPPVATDRRPPSIMHAILHLLHTGLGSVAYGVVKARGQGFFIAGEFVFFFITIDEETSIE